MWVCALCALGGVIFADAATLTTKVSPVQKVVELLDELKAKVQGDLAADETMMEEYSQYCDAEANKREDSITSAARTLSDLAAVIEESSASIDSLSEEVDELTSKISASESDLEDATKLRAQTRAAFEASEKELTETVDSLSRALIVLKRGQNFLQHKDTHEEIAKLVTVLGTISEAEWVPQQDRPRLQEFLQSAEEDGATQPQATVSAYESQGGGILDTLEDIKSKAEESLSSARKKEMESSHEFEMLKMSLDTKLADMKARLRDATAQRLSDEEAKAEASEEVESVKKSKAADELFLKDLKRACAEKAAQWAARQKSAAEEVAAVEKAKDILTSGVNVFLQVGKHLPREDDPQRREQLVRVISRLERAPKGSGDFSFSQLLLEAKQDPFAKVRDLIEGMINKLMEAAAEEAEAKAFCDTEMAKSRARQKKLTSTADMHAVRIEKAEARKAKLSQAIKILEAEVSEIDKSQEEATNLRAAEHEKFLKASADYEQSAEAVANAIATLEQYYSQGAFAQRQPDFGGAKTDIGTTIVSMLEVAESDLTTLLAEAKAEESAAVDEYEQQSQQNKVSKASKLTEAKEKSSEAKQVEMNLLNYKEDYASTLKEVDAVHTYLDKLKPQCEAKVMTYEERKAKREDEIGGLKEALTILEAS
jgi:DNA repair exonuclease SbcCD ATPase subunit